MKMMRIGMKKINLLQYFMLWYNKNYGMSQVPLNTLQPKSQHETGVPT
jgi:hypothetical protein